MTAKNSFNVAALSAMLEALGYAKVVAPIKATIAATKSAPIKASKALVMPAKKSTAKTKVAAPVEKGTISDEDLLAYILELADNGDAKGAFNVMIRLRQQNISCSRVRIRRVMTAWKEEQEAKATLKAMKSAAKKAKSA